MPVIDRNESCSKKTQPPTSLRLPSLDGWRAISIIMVIGGHSHVVAYCPGIQNLIFERIFRAEMGVRCFFFISGLLITWLLIGERETTGRVSLRHFYIRRALRILPVYFTFLGVLWCLHLFTPFTQSRLNWIGNLTFTSNLFATSWTSGHLWSLAVEEQFYLLWPVILVAAGLAKNPRRALICLCVPLLIAPMWRVISYKQFYPPGLGIAFTQTSFFNYFDCLAVGCLCAFLLKFWRTTVETCVIARPAIAAGVGLAVLALSQSLFLLHLPGRIVIGSTNSLQSLGFGLLLLQSVLLPQAGLYPVLNWKWVRHLGVLSYSIYIWQQIFCTKPATFGLGQVWWMSFPGWLFSALLVAHISYYALERPLLKLRSYFR